MTKYDIIENVKCLLNEAESNRDKCEFSSEGWIYYDGQAAMAEIIFDFLTETEN